MNKRNAHIGSLITRCVLPRSNKSINQRLEPPVRGMKITSSVASPADLRVSENHRSQKARISQAIDDAERASDMRGAEEAGANEMNGRPTEVRNLVSLRVALETVAAAESASCDADFAAGIANLTRARVLAQAATTALPRARATRCV